MQRKLYLNWYLAQRAAEPHRHLLAARRRVRRRRALQPLSSYKIDSGYRKLVTDEARADALRKRLAAHIGKN